MNNKQTKDGLAKADIAVETLAGIGVDFIRGKDGKDFNFRFQLAALPWDNDIFRQKLVMAAGGAITWRSGTSLKLLPEAGGIVDAETFAKAVSALDFRGDEKPNKDDIENAKTIINSVASKMYTFEDAAKFIKDDPKYGWDVEPSAEGMARHEMLKRLKARSSKPTTVALNTL